MKTISGDDECFEVLDICPEYFYRKYEIQELNRNKALVLVGIITLW